MAGRPAKPIKLHLMQGNPTRLTKAEIEKRQKSEIKMGDKTFVASKEIRENADALLKWNELIRFFMDVDFVTSSDVGLIERYCITWAEWKNLERLKKEVFEKGWGKVKTYNAINELGIEHNINKKLELLYKMDSQMFLSPLSKVRNIPRDKDGEREADPLTAAGFGNV